MARRRLPLCVLVSLGLLFFLCALVSANKKKPPAKPVNINTATAEELQQVPGIGPATAQKILQMRKSYGPFKSVDDLLAIRGLGQKCLDKMRKYLTVGGAAKAPSQPTSQPPQKQNAAASENPILPMFVEDPCQYKANKPRIRIAIDILRFLVIQKP